jgi:hypothetical protein
MACLTALEDYKVNIQTNKVPLLVIKAEIVSPCVSNSSYSHELSWGWCRKYLNISIKLVSDSDHFCLINSDNRQLISVSIANFINKLKTK